MKAWVSCGKIELKNTTIVSMFQGPFHINFNMPSTDHNAASTTIRVTEVAP